MKVIIVGCGKLGSQLALNLVHKGHKVTVIDTNAAALEQLGLNFQGETIVGIGFDQTILEQAQIRKADAVVACTRNDDSNALIARISKNIYKVPCAIARLYDPRSAEIYRSLGIQTISTTSWGVARVMDILTYSQLDIILTFGDNNADLIRIEVPHLLIGKTVNELTSIGEFQVIAISRNNQSFLPTLGTTLQQDDMLYMTVAASAAKKLKTMLGVML